MGNTVFLFFFPEKMSFWMFDGALEGRRGGEGEEGTVPAFLEACCVREMGSFDLERER